MPPSPRSLTVVALVVLAAVAAAPAAGLGSNGLAEPAGAHAGAAQGPDGQFVRAGGQYDRADGQYARAVDPDSVRMAVALEPDGDARWTITYRVRLEDDDETAAFESLRDDVESNPGNYTERFARRMNGTVDAAENATGREMAVRNVTVDARLQELGRTYGILAYSFEWTGFAAVDGDSIAAGDALGGLFLDGQTTLVVSWPADYGLADARPDPDDDVGDERSVGWAGPVEFGADEPRVVVERDAGSPLADLPSEGLLAAVLLALASVGAAVLWSRRRGVADVPAGATGANDVTGGPTPDDDAGDDPDEPPEELLSNEEKVLKLVRERGGRVKQQEIVEELDWTDAKTSQVVRDLRDEGDLEGFRLGRENVLRLPEAEADGGG